MPSALHPSSVRASAVGAWVCTACRPVQADVCDAVPRAWTARRTHAGATRALLGVLQGAATFRAYGRVLLQDHLHGRLAPNQDVTRNMRTISRGGVARERSQALNCRPVCGCRDGGVGPIGLDHGPRRLPHKGPLAAMCPEPGLTRCLAALAVLERCPVQGLAPMQPPQAGRLDVAGADWDLACGAKRRQAAVSLYHLAPGWPCALAAFASRGRRRSFTQPSACSLRFIPQRTCRPLRDLPVTTGVNP